MIVDAGLSEDANNNALTFYFKNSYIGFSFLASIFNFHCLNSYGWFG